MSTPPKGDTYALVYQDGDLTTDQFRALVELLWTLYPAGWPDGKTFTLPTGFTLRIVKADR